MSTRDDGWKRYIAWQVEVLRILEPVLPEPELVEEPVRTWLRALSTKFLEVPEALRELVTIMTADVRRFQSPLVGRPATAASHHSESAAFDLDASGQVRLTLIWEANHLRAQWNAALRDEAVVMITRFDVPWWGARLPAGTSEGELELTSSEAFDPILTGWSVFVIADRDVP